MLQVVGCDSFEAKAVFSLSSSTPTNSNPHSSWPGSLPVGSCAGASAGNGIPGQWAVAANRQCGCSSAHGSFAEFPFFTVFLCLRRASSMTHRMFFFACVEHEAAEKHPALYPGWKHLSFAFRFRGVPAYIVH
jgi:hypothetical protein